MGFDYRAAPNVPLVILPAGHLPAAPRLTERQRTALTDQAAALATLRDAAVHGGSGRRALETPLAAAIDASASATRGFAGHLHPVDSALGQPDRNPHDIYMGIGRGDPTGEQMAAEELAVFHRCLIDLGDACLDVNDFIAEIEAVIAVVGQLAAGAGGGEPRFADAAADRLHFRPSADPLERWIMGHHLYGVLLLWVADRLAAAVAALACSEYGTAASAVDQATVYLRGATAAMFHAGSIPAACYMELVRPTMRPPATPRNLGGSMNPESALARSSVDAFLGRCGESFPDLHARHPGLAIARNEFLFTDLIDIERHVTLAATLVGQERSLLQDEASAVNAVGILRETRSARAARYHSMMAFGDLPSSGSSGPSRVATARPARAHLTPR